MNNPACRARWPKVSGGGGDCSVELFAAIDPWGNLTQRATTGNFSSIAGFFADGFHSRRSEAIAQLPVEIIVDAQQRFHNPAAGPNQVVLKFLPTAVSERM
jgi:hypothetical protein